MSQIKATIQGKRGKQRSGKGFSKDELKQANLTQKDALRQKIPIDPKRKTTHEENVQTLKTYLKTHKPKPKPKKKPKS
jgi:ribosomal protein L13E